MPHKVSQELEKPGGHKELLDQVVSELYRKLGAVAHNKVRLSGLNSLNTFELVHEVYLKLASAKEMRAEDQEHFMALAATAMRHIIIDRVRMRKALRRGGDIDFNTLHESRVPWNDRAEEALVIDGLVRQLGEIDAKLSTTVECRYFAGYTEDQTARVLNVDVRTVRRYWSRARNWLEHAYAAGS